MCNIAEHIKVNVVFSQHSSHCSLACCPRKHCRAIVKLNHVLRLRAFSSLHGGDLVTVAKSLPPGGGGAWPLRVYFITAGIACSIRQGKILRPARAFSCVLCGGEFYASITCKIRQNWIEILLVALTMHVGFKFRRVIIVCVALRTLGGISIAQ